MTTSDRRAHPRHPVRILVQHHQRTDEPYEVDYASDLSHGGLFIKMRQPVPAGTTLHVQFAPARDARMVEAFCRVARVAGEGLGVEFVQMDDASQQLLEGVLRTIKPAFVPALAGLRELRA